MDEGRQKKDQIEQARARVRVSAGRATRQEPETVTRKDVEARRQAMKDANKETSSAKVAAHEDAKAKDPRSMCSTYALVQGATASQLEQIPDLDAAWVSREPIEFLAFLPQDNTGWYGEAGGGRAACLDSGTSAEAEQERGEVLKYCNVDCAKLLRLSCPRFWSHVIHNQSFHKFRDTYLRHATRYFDGEWTAVAAAAGGGAVVERRSIPQPEAELQRRVLMILYRMSQAHESAAHFMTADEFAVLIYDHWLWDIPMLLDVATIYGRSNPELVSELVSRVYSANAAYADDWGVSLKQVNQKLRDVAAMLKAESKSQEGVDKAKDEGQVLHM
jgi:hypothetical protein